MGKLICNVCQKENVAKDCQCDCGNILSEMFYMSKDAVVVVTSNSETRREKFKKEQEEVKDKILENAAIEEPEKKEAPDKKPKKRPTKRLSKRDIGKRKIVKTGSKPKKGTYVCIYCNEDVVLDDDTDKLPPCARCRGVQFVRENSK